MKNRNWINTDEALSRSSLMRGGKNWIIHHHWVYNRAKGIDNLKKLIKCTLRTLKKIYQKYPGCEDIIPNQTEYRCFILITNMITLEMFALFSPHKFKIDPYQILVQRGGGLFQSFVDQNPY